MAYSKVGGKVSQKKGAAFEYFINKILVYLRKPGL